nr:TRL domain-containing protein [uncultured Treponema sp.]
MKKGLLALAVLASALFIASCSTVRPVAGATGMVGSKTGEAKQTFLFGWPLKGEGGILQAAQNGGITKVGTVDLRIDWPASPAIPYQVVTTVVSGE